MSSSIYQIYQRYRVQVLISLVVSLGILAFNGEGDWVMGALTMAGSLFAIVMFELEYILDVYALDSSSNISKEARASFSQFGVRGILDFLIQNESRFTDLPIRSVLFQVLLTAFGYYIVLTNANGFAQGMVISMLGIMVYLQIMDIARGFGIKNWFWIYNGEITPQGEKSYIGIMFLLFVGLFKFV